MRAARAGLDCTASRAAHPPRRDLADEARDLLAVLARQPARERRGPAEGGGAVGAWHSLRRGAAARAPRQRAPAQPSFRPLQAQHPAQPRPRDAQPSSDILWDTGGPGGASRRWSCPGRASSLPRTEPSPCVRPCNLTAGSGSRKSYHPQHQHVWARTFWMGRRGDESAEKGRGQRGVQRRAGWGLMTCGTSSWQPGTAQTEARRAKGGTSHSQAMRSDLAATIEPPGPEATCKSWSTTWPCLLNRLQG